MTSNSRQLQRTLQTRLTRKADSSEVLLRPGGTAQTHHLSRLQDPSGMEMHTSEMMEVDAAKTAACICQRAKVGHKAVSDIIEVEDAVRGAVQRVWGDPARPRAPGLPRPPSGALAQRSRRLSGLQDYRFGETERILSVRSTAVDWPGPS